MNRPRLSCRSATAHKHVKAAVVVKVAGVGLVYRILPGSPASTLLILSAGVTLK